MTGQLFVYTRKTERKRQTPLPPWRQRDFADRSTVVSMDHGALAGGNRRVLGDKSLTPAKQQHIAAADLIAHHRHQMTQRGFGQLAKASMAEGALSTRHKELMALAIGVTSRCDGCIAYHARNSVRAGATRQEVAEALGVTIQMGGGPGITVAADALRARQQPDPVSAVNDDVVIDLAKYDRAANGRNTLT